MNNQIGFGRSSNSDKPLPGRPVPPRQPNEEQVPTPAQKGPDKPRKRRAHQNQVFVFFQFFFSLFVFAMLGLLATAYFGAKQFNAPGPLVQETTYTVPPGATLGQVAGALEQRGIISNSTVFEMAARASGQTNRIKTGEFLFEPQMSMRGVLDVIVSGRAIEYSVTIVEGMTVLKALERIAANEALAGPMPQEPLPEGALLADTKSFPRGTERTEVVRRLREAQTELVAEIWETRQPDLPLADMNAFVTLASIVEKETGVGGERPLVASVFVNRLRQGMRLQSDPTIIYGIFGGEGKPSDRPIYRSDIDTPTDYNTYTIDGLPPGPIAIPGRAALEAVANPAETDYLFFVADGTGGHAFARTLDEHNENVRKWREIERQREQEAGTAQ